MLRIWRYKICWEYDVIKCWEYDVIKKNSCYVFTYIFTVQNIMYLIFCNKLDFEKKNSFK